MSDVTQIFPFAGIGFTTRISRESKDLPPLETSSKTARPLAWRDLTPRWCGMATRGCTSSVETNIGDTASNARKLIRVIRRNYLSGMACKVLLTERSVGKIANRFSSEGLKLINLTTIGLSCKKDVDSTSLLEIARGSFSLVFVYIDGIRLL